MNIKVKSILSFGVLLLLFACCSIYQLSMTKDQNLELRQVNNVNLQSALLAQDLQQTLYEYQVQSMLPMTGFSTQDQVQFRLDNLITTFNDILNRYGSLNPSSVESVQHIANYFKDFTNPGPNLDPEIGQKLFASVGELRNASIEKITHSLDTTIQKGEAQQRDVMITLIVVFVLGAIISYVFAHRLVSPIKRLIFASSVISSGDLSNPLNVKGNDENGQLARNFEQMRINLSTFVVDSKLTSQKVASSCDKLANSAHASSESINRISDSLTAISNGAHTQMISTEETSKAMDEMSRGIEQISELANTVAELTITMELEAKEGTTTLSVSEEQLKSFHQTFRYVSDTVAKLESHSRAINEIIQVIHEISEQTHLLSLNAAIEAARAGDIGSGFAIVADEIRKLSGQTKISSDHVNDIVKVIQSDIHATVKMVSSSEENVKQSESAVRAARETFEHIVVTSAKISHHAQEVSAATEQMSSGSEEVCASVNELTEIAKLSYAESHSIVLAAQEQQAAMQETTTSMESLRQLSIDLQGSISKFKV